MLVLLLAWILRLPLPYAAPPIHQVGVMTERTTVTALYCHLGKAKPRPDWGVVFVVQKNGEDQAVACTIAGASTTCNDTSNTFNASPGDRISVKSDGGDPRDCGLSTRPFLPKIFEDDGYVPPIEWSDGKASGAGTTPSGAATLTASTLTFGAASIGADPGPFLGTMTIGASYPKIEISDRYTCKREGKRTICHLRGQE